MFSSHMLLNVCPHSLHVRFTRILKVFYGRFVPLPFRPLAVSSPCCFVPMPFRPHTRYRFIYKQLDLNEIGRGKYWYHIGIWSFRQPSPTRLCRRVRQRSPTILILLYSYYSKAQTKVISTSGNISRYKKVTEVGRLKQ